METLLLEVFSLYTTNYTQWFITTPPNLNLQGAQGGKQAEERVKNYDRNVGFGANVEDMKNAFLCTVLIHVAKIFSYSKQSTV